MKKRFVFFCALGFICSKVIAQEEEQSKVTQLSEVVVSDSRFELKREHSGKTVVKITKEELERSQAKTLAEIINSKSGIEINGSRGVAGQNLGYYVRGGNNRQVLVLIDGIQVNDPSQIANDFDLRLLAVSDIESIEIIKGAASTLYGNAAATAVISITTKKASGKKAALNVSTIVGTNQDQGDQNYDALANITNSVSVNGTLNKLSYIAGFGNQYTNGLSAFDGDNAERDPFSRFNTNLKLGYQFSENFKITASGNYDKFKTEIDGFLADTNDSFISEQFRVTLQPEFTYENGSVTLNAGHTKIKRNFVFETYDDIYYDSDVFILDVFNKYVFNNQFYTIVGLNYQKNETVFGEELEITNTDPYINMVYVSDFGLNINTGARLNNHSEYGSHFIYNINPSYRFPLNDGYAKVFGSYSTSFIAPSLYQLFDGFYGNPYLEAEENRTAELGIEFKPHKNIRFSGLYFNRNEDNTVLFGLVDEINFIYGYVNAAENAKVHGAEVEFEANLFDSLNFSANYSFTELKEGYRVRLPKHRANATLGYGISDDTFVSVSGQYVGSRYDTDFSTFLNTELDAYTLIDFHISHQFKNDKLKIFAGITNVFNEDYAEIIGFTTRGRNINFGIEYKHITNPKPKSIAN